MPVSEYNKDGTLSRQIWDNVECPRIIVHYENEIAVRKHVYGDGIETIYRKEDAGVNNDLYSNKEEIIIEEEGRKRRNLFYKEITAYDWIKLSSYLYDPDGQMIEECFFAENSVTFSYFKNNIEQKVIVTEFFFDNVIKSIINYDVINNISRITSKTIFYHPNTTWDFYNRIKDSYYCKITKSDDINRICIESINHDCFKKIKYKKKYFYNDETSFYPSKVETIKGKENYVEEYTYTDLEIDNQDSILVDYIFESEYLELDFLWCNYDYDFNWPPKFKKLKSVEVFCNGIIVEQKDVEFEDECHHSCITTKVFNGFVFLDYSTEIIAYNETGQIDGKTISFNNRRGEYIEEYNEGDLVNVYSTFFDIDLRDYLISRQCPEFNYINISTLENESSFSQDGFDIFWQYNELSLVTKEDISNFYKYDNVMVDETSGRRVIGIEDRSTFFDISYDYFNFPKGLKSVKVRKGAKLTFMQTIQNQSIEIKNIVLDYYDCEYQSQEDVAGFCSASIVNDYDEEGRLSWSLNEGGYAITIHYISRANELMSKITTTYIQHIPKNVYVEHYLPNNERLEYCVEFSDSESSSSLLDPILYFNTHDAEEEDLIYLD